MCVVHIYIMIQAWLPMANWATRCSGWWFNPSKTWKLQNDWASMSIFYCILNCLKATSALFLSLWNNYPMYAVESDVAACGSCFSRLFIPFKALGHCRHLVQPTGPADRIWALHGFNWFKGLVETRHQPDFEPEHEKGEEFLNLRLCSHPCEEPRHAFLQDRGHMAHPIAHGEFITCDTWRWLQHSWTPQNRAGYGLDTVSTH